MEVQKLSNILNNIHNGKLLKSELFDFIEFMYKKLNPNKIYNIDTIEKLFMIEQFLQIVLAHYISLIEENPKDYGLKYTKIYNKSGTLVKTIINKL